MQSIISRSNKVIFITLFVIIIISLLGINFYVSSQFSDDAKEINLAGRQRMLSQRMVKSVQNLIQAQTENKGINKSLGELNLTFNLFDNTLKAFTNGGDTTGADGQLTRLNKVDVEDSIKAISAANLVWVEYRTAVEKLINSDITALISSAKAIEYVTNNNESLLAKMEQLTAELQNEKYSGVYINLSGRQRMLSQRIAKTLLELVNAQINNSDTSRLIQQLSIDQQNFSQTFNLLLEGGNLDFDSSNTEISAITDDLQLVELIKQGQNIWQSLDTSITEILQSDTGVFELLASANALAQKENLNLLKLMNDLTVSLDEDSTQRADLLRYVQVFGILLAVLMFGIIILFFVKQLRKSDQELDQAKSETDRIFEIVNDGLFLMDREHSIGTQHSDSLVKVINVEQPAGKSFISILRKIVPEKTLETAKDYLDLLYGDRVNEELVTDLNPLDNVEVCFGGNDLGKHVGHLGFQFKRVFEKGIVSHLLVQVEDITDKIKLEKELALSKEKAQAQFDLMLEVLHVKPDMLGHFLTESENSLREINNILQEKARSEKDTRGKLTPIARFIHRIKGDAAGLELEGFELKAHDFEELIEELKQRKELTGKDFLPLAISLDEFMGQIESLRALIAKLSELQGSINKDDLLQTPRSDSNGRQLSKTLGVLSNSVANKQSKKVLLNVFNEHLMPMEYAKYIQDILTQLIRNSIVHGIESPDQRSLYSKTDEGLINIKFSRDAVDNSVFMEYTDDGKGLIVEDILLSAVNKGMVSRETSLTLSKKQIMSLIFQPGFSTKNTSDLDAGRGVGMDVVIDLVKKMQCKIGLNSIENKLFKLTMKLPDIKSTTHLMEIK